MADIAAGIAIVAVSVLYLLEVGEFLHGLVILLHSCQSFTLWMGPMTNGEADG